jgi:hypothetical protein
MKAEKVIERRDNEMHMVHLSKSREVKEMSGKFQLKGGIYEPSSDIPLNWRDMRNEFRYKLLYDI